MTFFLENNFAAMLSYTFPSDIAIVKLKLSLKWAARICGSLKWATARKRLRDIGLGTVEESTLLFFSALGKLDVPC